MAEEVQRILDGMVPALADLQERSVFSQREIHAIVDRRRQSEYAVRRRHPRKADFLRYIQDEHALERLRLLRVNRQQRENPELFRKPAQDDNDHDENKKQNRRQGRTSFKHIGDLHIVQHLHLLWTRILRKYKDDVQLYLQYAEFCKQVHATNRLSRLYGEAVRLHPHAVDLWMEAASHEFFAAGSIQNARVLMQRGLRANSTFGSGSGGCESLWIQLFCLELHFATKMKGRQLILLGAIDDTQKKNNRKDMDPISDGSVEDPFKIATLVYQQAIESARRSASNNQQQQHDVVRFGVRFWDSCRQFPDTQPLRRRILQSLLDQCGDNPEAWLAWALFAWEQEKENPKTAKATKGKDDNWKEDDADDSDNDQEEEESEEKQPTPKKQKGNDGNAVAVVVSEHESILTILKKAVEEIETEEMYLKAARMVNRYIDELQTRSRDVDTHAKVEAAVAFLEELLSNAAKASFYSADLALEYATFLTRSGQKQEAVTCLEHFIESNSSSSIHNKNHVPAGVWIHLAELSERRACTILSRACQHIPPDRKDHFGVLLRLFGSNLQRGGEQDPDGLFSLFVRMLLLAAGFRDSLVLKEESFGVKGLADACLKYLDYVREVNSGKTNKTVQKIYQAVLYKSTIGKTLLEVDEDATIQFFSTAIEAEKASKSDSKIQRKKRRNNLRRLYDTIIDLLGESTFADDFRQQKREDLISASSGPGITFIPKLNARSHGFNATSLAAAFENYRVVHLTNVSTTSTKDVLKWQHIGELFASLGAKDQESWCVETDHGGNKNKMTPEDFLVPKSTRHRAYSSFLVQKDLKAYEQTESRLPLAKLPGLEWSYEPALWIFFGRNPPGNNDLPGRPDHTDSISSNGTWHFQLSGIKKWTIRPTQELLQRMSSALSPSDFENWKESSRVEISCRQGDVLVINTRLWFHQTFIPPQPAPSVSYARDFWCGTSTHATKASMSNVDGLYATNDVEEGVIIFTDDKMPDCNLHESDNPNCELVELEDGRQAIVSCRAIQSGEFFCVAKSDDEDEDDNEEGE